MVFKKEVLFISFFQILHVSFHFKHLFVHQTKDSEPIKIGELVKYLSKASGLLVA